MRISSLTAALLALLFSQAHALYFYLQVSLNKLQRDDLAILTCEWQAGETRCFLEELPKDTIVVGHYKAEEWTVDDARWIINDRLGIQITVEASSGTPSCSLYNV